MNEIGLKAVFTADTSQFEQKFKEMRGMIDEDKNFQPFINPTPQGTILDASGNPYKTEKNNSFLLPDNNGKYLSFIQQNTTDIVDLLKAIEKGLSKNGENPNNLPPREQDKEMPAAEKLLKRVKFKDKVETAESLISDGMSVAQSFIVDRPNADKQKMVSILQGDVYGAQQSEIDKVKATEKGIVGGAKGLLAAGGLVVGSLVGVGPVAGGMIGNAAGNLLGLLADCLTGLWTGSKEGDIEKKHAISGMYNESLPTYERALPSFFDMSGTDENYFRARQRELSDLFLAGSKDTNLDLPSFIEAATDLSKYGVSDAQKANDMTRQAAMYAKYTNGDVGQYNSFIGAVSRYGGENENALDIAYGAARASGLQNAQFGEFLEGLESVIESGISNGFVRSTEDVAGTLTMLSNLSGGSEFWKGEQGAQRLNQINSGLVNAHRK
ncbi:MAG: hypothetical protein IJ191_02000 [Treponema sp.]|nr:hypothetical protein [Treponema sp.]